jgi:glycosyltransferase involved in cell wall biosynthesis
MKNKILFFIQLPPPVHGSSIVGKMVSDNLKINNNFNTVFINSSLSTNTGQVNIFKVEKIIHYFKLIRSFIKQVHSFKPELFYIAMTASGIGFLKDFPFILYCKLKKIKVVIHLHNKGIAKYSRNIIYRLLYFIVFKNSKVIILSKKLSIDIPDYVKNNDIYICNNGMKKLVTQIPKKSPSNKVRILFISNLIESKGVFILLESLKLLLESNISFCCDIVGGAADVSEEILLKKINDLGLLKNVNYLGKLYGEKKDKIFKESDIFVFPTYYKNEAFPLVILESFMYGIPVITTNEGGISDIVRNKINGLIIKKESSYEAFRAIQKLVNEPRLYEKISLNCINDFNNKYTKKIFDDRIYGILKMIVNE